MVERILVPLDDSEPAREALVEALERFRSDEVVVLHVLDTSETSHGAQGGAADGLVEAKRQEAEELLDEARSIARDRGRSIETVVEQGRPADVIVDYVEGNDVDHVVMGSHGRSGVSRLLVGSVAETVARNSPVSVTIARGGSSDR